MLTDFLKKSNNIIQLNARMLVNEPLSEHTTFKAGGNAALFIQPLPALGAEELGELWRLARVEGLDVRVIGRGANTLFGDDGFSGLVLDMSLWADSSVRSIKEMADGAEIFFHAGASIDRMVEHHAACSFGKTAADSALGADVMDTLINLEYRGLEFLAGLPGTVGGAVYMNARCYGASLSDRLVSVDIIDEEGVLLRVPFRAEEWGYKKSPFQNRGVLIVGAAFALYKGERDILRAEMESHRADRERKGHYRHPSAGSVFKNNEAFGKPSGKIIDELGLRGRSRGGAMIAPFHGNIIINTGGATASDIRLLAEETAETVLKHTGFALEPEIIFYF